MNFQKRTIFKALKYKSCVSFQAKAKCFSEKKYEFTDSTHTIYCPTNSRKPLKKIILYMLVLNTFQYKYVCMSWYFQNMMNNL